jgi:hypothetical protein
LGGDCSLESEADGRGVEGLLCAIRRAVDSDGNVCGRVVVLVLDSSSSVSSKSLVWQIMGRGLGRLIRASAYIR